MKKILVLNFSPRKKGNCAAITDLMAKEITAKGGEAVVYAINDIEVKGCKACGACKKKDEPFCVQKDDFKAMLPLIDSCDGIVFASPIYFGQIPGTMKNFIDRFYCFFNPAKAQPLFTPKDSKKAAVIFTCGGGDVNAYEAVAQWVGGCLRTIGTTEVRSLVRNGLNDLWDAEEPVREDMAEKATALADWLSE